MTARGHLPQFRYLPVLCVAWVLAACSGERNRSADEVINITQTSNVALTAPTNVAIGATTATLVKISWTAASTAAGIKYQITREGRTEPLGETTATSYDDNTVIGGARYVYRVRTLDAAGNQSSLSMAAETTTPQAQDTEAPATPAQLNASTLSASSVSLDWSASSDNVGVVKYQLFRGNTVLAEVSDTRYVDETVTGSTAYSYIVKAVDAANNVSAASPAASVTTPAAADTTAPSTPSNLAAVATSATRADLSWSASTDDTGVTKYQIFRVGSSAPLAETTDVTYADETVVGDTNYSYTVKSLDAANNASAASNTANVRTPATTDTTAPSAPGNLGAAAPSATRVNLSWNASTDNVGVTRYQVFRVGRATPLAEVATTSYVDNSVVGNTNYSYTIKALDAANNVSAASNTASVRTPAAADTTAPSVPGNLSATAAGAAQINLSWSASTDNVGVTKYQVFRVGVSGPLAEHTGVSYEDKTVASGTTYSYTVRAVDAANNVSAASNAASATTTSNVTAPVISTQPISQTISVGNSVNFSVQASGTAPLTYQWRKGSTNIATATSSIMYLNPVQAADAGSYSVVVTNAAGSVTSNAAVLTVQQTAVAPSITTHPSNQSVNTNNAASFTVQASGTATLSYRWQRRANSSAAWADVSGATQATLTLSSVAASDDGSQYRCVVSNSVGNVASNAATLIVASGMAYYVSPTGSNNNAGTRALPWRTIAYAVSSSSPAPQGSTIYVQAGNYGAENVVFGKDGLSLIGYRSTPGDQPAILANTSTPFAAFDSAEAPLLDGGDRAVGIGVNLRGRKNITLRNVNVVNYRYGVIAGNASQSFVENHLLFNVNVSTIGDTSASYSGMAINLGSMGTLYSNGVTVRNSLIVNAAAEGLTVTGNDNVVDNVKVYCNENSGGASTDYYIMVTGNDNLVENSLVNRASGLSHYGHGFSIKSNAEQVVDRGSNYPVVNPRDNLFRNNTAINVGEGYVVRHRGARFNIFRDNKMYGSSGGSNCEGNGIVIRDGASDNQFINTIVEDACSAVRFNDTVEDGDTGSSPTGHPGNNNVIDGLAARNVYYGVSFNDYSVQSDAGANVIKNSTFLLTRNMFGVNRHATQMSYVNTKFSGTNAVTPRPGGRFRTGSYSSDVVKAQFDNACTFENIEGGMPW